MLSIKGPSEQYQATHLQVEGAGVEYTATWKAREEADFLLCISDGFRKTPSLEDLLERMTPEQQQSLVYGTTVKLEGEWGICVLQNVKWNIWAANKKCDLDIKGVLRAPLRAQIWAMKGTDVFRTANPEVNCAAVRAIVTHKIKKPPFWKFFDKKIKSTITVAGGRTDLPDGCLEYRVDGAKRFSYPIPSEYLEREFAVKAKEVSVKGANGYEDLFVVRTVF